MSELDQARFLVRGTTLALAAGVERVCWYTVTDYQNFLHDKEAAFGFFRYQPPPATGPLEPKPAFTAAATFARVLGNARFARDLRQELRLPDEAYALSFRDRRTHRTVIVFWATRDGVPVHAGVASSARRVQTVPFDGTPATDLGRTNALDLTLGRSPLYVVLDERG